MTEVVTLSLENEMDLVLAHKRTMGVAEKLGLTIATQTTFSTAVSEIARTVIEHTDNGNLIIGLEQNKTRYSLKATVTFDSEVKFNSADEGFYYAQKLVPEFEMTKSGDFNKIEMKIGLPRSLKLDPLKINQIKTFFANEAPLSAYEEIKRKNDNLNKLTEEQDEEIKRSRLVDEKKTEFISIASHEIKTPMTVLRAFTQMAKASNEEMSPRLRELLGKIDVQSGKLLSLVQQLLDISKIENGNLQYDMQRVSLNDFIKEQIALLKTILPFHQITMSLSDDRTLLIDKLRMEQVFSNLLGNAAKYSEKDSVINVYTATTEPGFITVAITDNGCGMTGETTKSIFQKFYRSADVVKTHVGLGMGLYISSKIITDHGGRIWVESKKDAGSTFFFNLPIVEDVI